LWDILTADSVACALGNFHRQYSNLMTQILLVILIICLYLCLEKGGKIMKWITRSQVHVDRVACPWLIKRFADSEAEIMFVPKSQINE